MQLRLETFSHLLIPAVLAVSGTASAAEPAVAVPAEPPTGTNTAPAASAKQSGVEPPKGTEPPTAAEKTAAAPPANTGLLFDGKIGSPRLEGGGVSVVGGGMLGYQSAHLGGVAYGNFSAFGTASREAVVTSRRSNVSGSFWGNFGTAETHLQVRGVFGYTGYFTRRLPLDGSLLSLRERSVMGRINATLGAHHQPKHGRLGVTLWAGGGAQLEGYSLTEVNVGQLSLSSDLLSTFTASATSELRAFLYTGSFGLLRLESDLMYFRITKATATLDIDSTVSATLKLTRASQLDSDNRLYFDVLAAQWFGFVPFVHAALDLTHAWSGDTRPLTVVVPSAGIGLRQRAFQ